MLAEAMAQRAHAAAPLPDTGRLATDLDLFLTDTARAMAEPPTRHVLRQLMGSAQHDPHTAEALADFTAQRRAQLRALLERGQTRQELPARTNLDTLIDLVYGFFWYRLLVNHAPLDDQAARELTEALLALGTESPRQPDRTPTTADARSPTTGAESGTS